MDNNKACLPLTFGTPHVKFSTVTTCATGTVHILWYVVHQVTKLDSYL